MRLAVAWTALLAAGSLCACSHSDSTVPPDAASDTIEDQTALEDSGADVTPMAYEAAAPSPLVGVRVANFSASAPPFDLCLAPHGTTNWIGPMFAAAGPQDPDASAPGVVLNEDGGAAGLAFPGVSAYFYVPPGQYDARWTAAGSAQCPTVGAIPDTTLPMLSEGGIETVAWFDQASAASAGADAGPDSGRAWEIVPFADDLAVPADSGPGFFALRFINAAPSVPLANLGNQIILAGTPPGAVSGMLAAVPYQAASQSDERANPLSQIVDGNGFLLAPSSSATAGFAFVAEELVRGALLAVVGHPTITLVTGNSNVSNVAAGAVLTVVLLAGSDSELSSSDGGAGDAGAFALLQCVDNAGTLGVGGACGLISQ